MPVRSLLPLMAMAGITVKDAKEFLDAPDFGDGDNNLLRSDPKWTLFRKRLFDLIDEQNRQAKLIADGIKYLPPESVIDCGSDWRGMPCEGAYLVMLGKAANMVRDRIIYWHEPL